MEAPTDQLLQHLNQTWNDVSASTGNRHDALTVKAFLRPYNLVICDRKKTLNAHAC
uniref:Uncharacterized protein n=1 Tax=Arundo donax TaxID=35708 RepID=A0A0A9D4Y1_ARUDO